MTTEPQSSSISAPDEGAQWLEGLAGRESNGTLASEGAKLRQQLDWPDTALPADMPPDLASLVGRQQAPAHRRQPRWAWAAVLMLACGVGWWQLAPTTPETWRGAGGGTVFHWIVEGSPSDNAGPLAQELRQLGAQVELLALQDGVELQVSAAEPERAAVNGRLAVLEAALDSQGRCRIQVRR